MKTTAALVCLLLLGARADAQQNHDFENARGLYLYTFNVAVEKSPAQSPDVTQAMSQPGMDGITLVENWSAIEPARGVFEWSGLPAGRSLFDQWIAAAAAAGRKVNLAIRAGQDTPCWLFETGGGACGAAYTGTYAGARRWRFEASPHQGLAKPVCETVDIVAPWDPVFLAEWDAMLSGVAQHLHDIGAYDSVALVRLTGINRTTDEFRLPEEILDSPCTDANGQQHVDTNSISTWLAAGYRPSLLEQAWDSITSSFARSFPDKTFNVPIIPIGTGHGQNPFPEIDDSGCVYTALVDPSEWPVPAPIPPLTCANAAGADDANRQLNDVLFDLLGVAAAKFPGHLVVEFENLDTSTPASPTVVDAAQTLGTMTGFMTNNYMAAVSDGVGAACSGGFGSPQVCPDSASYLALVNIGVYPCQTNGDNPWCQGNNLQSEFIEIFATDAAMFPDAVLQAHTELHRSPNARREEEEPK